MNKVLCLVQGSISKRRRLRIFRPIAPLLSFCIYLVLFAHAIPCSNALHILLAPTSSVTAATPVYWVREPSDPDMFDIRFVIGDKDEGLAKANFDVKDDGELGVGRGEVVFPKVGRFVLKAVTGPWNEVVGTSNEIEVSLAPTITLSSSDTSTSNPSATSTSTPTQTPSPPAPPSGRTTSKIIPIIVGALIGSFLLLALIVMLVLFLLNRRRLQREKESSRLSFHKDEMVQRRSRFLARFSRGAWGGGLGGAGSSTGGGGVSISRGLSVASRTLGGGASDLHVQSPASAGSRVHFVPPPAQAGVSPLSSPTTTGTHALPVIDIRQHEEGGGSSTDSKRTSSRRSSHRSSHRSSGSRTLRSSSTSSLSMYSHTSAQQASIEATSSLNPFSSPPPPEHPATLVLPPRAMVRALPSVPQGPSVGGRELLSGGRLPSIHQSPAFPDGAFRPGSGSSSRSGSSLRMSVSGSSSGRDDGDSTEHETDAETTDSTVSTQHELPITSLASSTPATPSAMITTPTSGLTVTPTTATPTKVRRKRFKVPHNIPVPPPTLPTPSSTRTPTGTTPRSAYYGGLHPPHTPMSPQTPTTSRSTTLRRLPALPTTATIEDTNTATPTPTMPRHTRPLPSFTTPPPPPGPPPTVPPPLPLPSGPFHTRPPHPQPVRHKTPRQLHIARRLSQIREQLDILSVRIQDGSVPQDVGGRVGRDLERQVEWLVGAEEGEWARGQSDVLPSGFVRYMTP